MNHNPEERPTATMILNQIPPSVDNIKQFVQKIDTSIVSRQTVSIYLRKFTRRENVEGIADINPKEHSFQNYRLLVSRIADAVSEKLKNSGANYFAVPLFLPKSHIYFNVSTNVCLLNDKSAAVYAIPSDRRLVMYYYLIEKKFRYYIFYFRLCYIYYLKNNTPINRRYSIDTIYRGNENGTYDEVTECNYDETDGSVVNQIRLQIDFIKSLSPGAVLIINLNHKSLYSGAMSFLNISAEDLEILEKGLLLHDKVKLIKTLNAHILSSTMCNN